MRVHKGFTLIESLIALSVTTLLVTLLLSVYVQGTSGYTHVQFQRIVETAVETAMLEIGTACRDAMYAKTQGTRLILLFPQDTDAYGHPIPTVGAGDPIYRPGNLFIYYLAGPSGSPATPGTILWQGKIDSNGTLIPDLSWSLMPGSTRGRITPITTFIPVVTTARDGIYVTLVVEAVLRVHGTVYRARRQATWAIGNASSWR